MNIQFVKYLKDIRKPTAREWMVDHKNGEISSCSSVENQTYYTACYVSDVNLQTHGIDEKAILLLLHRKDKEMNGDGIVKYLEAIQISKIVSRLTNFKPCNMREYRTERTEEVRGGVPVHFVKNIENSSMSLIKVAYKVDGEYKYISAFPRIKEEAIVTESALEEWKRLDNKDKFYFFNEFIGLEKLVWKILYKLKAKCFLTERYVKGRVGTNRRGRYYGVKAKRFYTLTDAGREYLKNL